MSRVKSQYQKAKEALQEERAIELYQDGYSLRQAQEMLAIQGIKKSHQWIANVLKKHGIPVHDKKRVV